MIERAYGLARRDIEAPNTPETQFATASGLKGMTALAVMCLVEDGVLRSTRPRVPFSATTSADRRRRHSRASPGASLRDRRLPRRGRGDTTSPTTSSRSPCTRSSRTEATCRSSTATRSSPQASVRLLQRRLHRARADRRAGERRAVPRPRAAARIRRGRPPRHGVPPLGRAAGACSARPPLRRGPRTNVLHLPVRGTGDGGKYTTLGDMRTFWKALFDGKIVPLERVATMAAPCSDVHEKWQYGLGLWIVAGTSTVGLEGHDAGVSFGLFTTPRRTRPARSSRTGRTVPGRSSSRSSIDSFAKGRSTSLAWPALVHIALTPGPIADVRAPHGI